MSLRPPTSRCQLSWKVFSRQDNGNWVLTLPPYYADLFAIHHPIILGRSNTGFRDSKSGKTKFAFFSNLDEEDTDKIDQFLAHYGRSVCLNTNNNTEDHFSDELDFGLALDFNKPSTKKGRTQIGEWEYQAKYHQIVEARDSLVTALVIAIRMLPLRRIPKPRILTYVPCAADRDEYLPAILTHEIIENFPSKFWETENPLMKSTLTIAKKSAKNMTVEEKIKQWKLIAQKEGINLSRSVKGASVIVVDDLYQSGASLWSFAKFLKSKGASTVVGVACVKSLRDTDNQ